MSAGDISNVTSEETLDKCKQLYNGSSEYLASERGRLIYGDGTFNLSNSTDDVTVEVDAPHSKTDELRKDADILQDKICVLINEFYDKNGVCDIDVSIVPSFENTPIKGRERIATTVKVNISI